MAYARIINSLGPIGKAHRKVDDWIAKVPEELRKELPCKRGCAHCCHQFILVSVPEAMYMVKDLISTPQGRKWLQAHSQVFNQQAKLINGISERELGAIRNKWFDESTPCAFLDEQTKECVIYQNRPAVCRSYFVKGSPEQCAGPSGHQIAVLDSSASIASIVLASVEVAAEFKISAVPIPLPFAVLWALVGYLSGLGYLRHAMKSSVTNISIKI